jgi:Xaa-Pro aminopeptidase
MAQVKSKSEIQKIKKACQATDAIFKKIISRFHFKTEIELRDFILDEIKKKGLKPSFPPIVTSGARAGNEIHPQSTDARLEGFVIIDFGVIYEKYMSDMTRTIFVGKPSKDERKIYDLVLKSQQRSIEVSKHGVKCALSDRSARDVLGEHSKYFIHMLGHGVGTRIHELPKIFYKLEKPIFKTGMIVTFEPGVYMPGKLGIRIEDTGLVEKKGIKILTNSPKKLLVFKP